MLLSKDKTSEIVSVSMASLFSFKFFEHFNSQYQFNIIFTMRELFKYVVIITLIILMISELILQMVCI